jgi:hypothetical protein
MTAGPEHVGETMKRRIVAVVLACALASIGLGVVASAAGAVTTQVAEYQFQDNLIDGLHNAPDLVNVGTGTTSFADDGVDGHFWRVLQWPAGTGLSLATNGVIPNDSYTIVMLMKFRNVNGYRRILDFKNGTDDSGLYDINGQLQLWPDEAGPDALIQPGKYAQVAITRDSSGTVTGYVDGTQEFSIDDSSDQFSVIDANNTLRFFLDNTSGGATGEEGPGSVARLRLWNGPLDATTIQGLDRLPGDHTDTQPICEAGAGIPHPPKPPTNAGTVKIAKPLTETGAVKDTKVSIGGTLENCANFPPIPKAVGPVTDGLAKVSITVPPGSTCDALTPGTPPVKGTISITWKTPNPKKPGKLVTAGSDKTTVHDFVQSVDDPREFTVISDLFSMSKTAVFHNERADMTVWVDEDASTIANLCSSKKALSTLHFTGVVQTSHLEMLS